MSAFSPLGSYVSDAQLKAYNDRIASEEAHAIRMAEHAKDNAIIAKREFDQNAFQAKLNRENNESAAEVQASEDSRNTDLFGQQIDTDFAGKQLPYMSEADRISERMNKDAFGDDFGKEVANTGTGTQKVTVEGVDSEGNKTTTITEASKDAKEAFANNQELGTATRRPDALDLPASQAPVNQTPAVTEDLAPGVLNEYDSHMSGFNTDTDVFDGFGLGVNEDTLLDQEQKQRLKSMKFSDGHPLSSYKKNRDEALSQFKVDNDIYRDRNFKYTPEEQAKISEFEKAYSLDRDKELLNIVQGRDEVVTDNTPVATKENELPDNLKPGKADAFGSYEHLYKGVKSGYPTNPNLSQSQNDAVISAVAKAAEASLTNPKIIDGDGNVINSEVEKGFFDKISEWTTANPGWAGVIGNAAASYIETGNIYEAAGAGIRGGMKGISNAAASKLTGQELERKLLEDGYSSENITTYMNSKDINDLGSAKGKSGLFKGKPETYNIGGKKVQVWIQEGTGENYYKNSEGGATVVDTASLEVWDTASHGKRAQGDAIAKMSEKVFADNQVNVPDEFKGKLKAYSNRLNTLAAFKKMKINFPEIDFTNPNSGSALALAEGTSKHQLDTLDYLSGDGPKPASLDTYMDDNIIRFKAHHAKSPSGGVMISPKDFSDASGASSMEMNKEAYNKVSLNLRIYNKENPKKMMSDSEMWGRFKNTYDKIADKSAYIDNAKGKTSGFIYWIATSDSSGIE